MVICNSSAPVETQARGDFSVPLTDSPVGAGVSRRRSVRAGRLAEVITSYSSPLTGEQCSDLWSACPDVDLQS